MYNFSFASKGIDVSVKLTTDELVLRFKRVHGDKYDYSKFKHVNSYTPALIICKIHGEFKQNIHVHGKGGGCPECGKILIIENNKKRNKKIAKNFIDKARKKHRDKYDYSLTKYIKHDQKVIIICKIHGKFSQIAKNHLIGHGCKQCALEDKKRKMRMIFNNSKEI